jgi:hypothetical protein
MPTENFFIAYPPVRFGLLVREDNIDDLVVAAGLSTLPADGIYDPIIPVSKNNSGYARSLRST